jgi:polyhydroxyalkanoate synthesis repressor PhaR
MLALPFMSESSSRIVKRYSNRKLYDTRESCYVTLDQIAEMIRGGEEVKVVDNNSKEDLTSVTLAQIIFEEEKKQRSFLPLTVLRQIVQSGGQSLSGLMNQLSESAERMGRVFHPDAAEPNADAGPGLRLEPAHIVRDFIESVQRTMEEWQKSLDLNLHQTLESVSPLAPLQKELQSLRERIAELEKKLSQEGEARELNR